MNRAFEFWDALAPHHSALENSYLDLPSVRRILDKIQSPVLVVGAGQGLIVAELRRRKFQCDGVDLSSEMIRYAKLRRGLALVQADARAMPFRDGAYKTIIYATGVIDFMSDEEAIRAILHEGRRVANHSGVIFVAFYRMNAASERLLARVGLLQNHLLRFREAMAGYQLTPIQVIRWVARRAKVGYARAVMLLLRSSAGSGWQEKRNAFYMRRIFANANYAQTLLQAAPEQQPYRNEAEIRNLFARLRVPIKDLEAFRSCYMARI